MTHTQVGTGITPSEGPRVQQDDQVTLSRDDLKAMIHEEMTQAVADVERRLAQARELEASALYGRSRKMHTEDLNINRHLIDGYTLTANSPSGGSIAWSNLHVVLSGVDYTITNGNSANKYIYFVKPGSGTSATLSSSNTFPTLGPQDALIFVNDGGTPYSVLESSVPPALMPFTVSDAVENGALDSTTFYATLQTTLSDQDDAIALAQATADGAVETYFQNEPPWPAGSPAPGANDGSAKTGDVWYDANDAKAYRWTGPSGTPVNSWVEIADTDTSALAAQISDVEGEVALKITTFYANAASTPSATAVGDLWVVTDQNNKMKRASSTGTGGWQDILFGDSAISGVGANKVSGVLTTGNIPNLDMSKVTTGTLSGTRVGSGISASNVTTGTLPVTRLNTSVHLLY